MDLDDSADDHLHIGGVSPPSATVLTAPAPAPAPFTDIAPAPTPKVPSNTISAIPPFSTPYKSPFIMTPPPSRSLLSALESLNCSYLSSTHAPTLLQLKQHAQSLTILIRELTVSRSSALVNNANANLPQAGHFEQGESFDWLNDLSTRYENADPHHSQPLTSILNTVEPDPDTGEARHICPLQEVVSEGDKMQSRPWATHQNLIRHANELLERLDHEYSARGGLLSIFPTDLQKEDREKAEKTVLGQMIFWVQNLVQRIHHLERLYANSMDVLASEAVVPTETLSALGAQGRKGREVVYPQDRFVLVNAGDDVWQFLNAEFERREVIDQELDKRYRDLGTTGEAIWRERGGKEFARGITAIDIYTRYYRLRDNPLKTVFVIPAYEKHPGTKVTREMESQPTVVSVVKPVWPERLSVLEQKHRDDSVELKQERQLLQREMRKSSLQEQEIALLKDNNERLKEERQILIRERDVAQDFLRQNPNQSKLTVFEELSRASAARHEAARVRAVYEKQIEDTKTAAEKAKEHLKNMEESRSEQATYLETQQKENEKRWAKKSKQLENRDADLGRVAQDVVSQLKKVWLEQMTESQQLIKFLSSREAQEALKDIEVPDSVLRLGEDEGRTLLEEVARTIPDTVPPSEDESDSTSESGREGVHGRPGGDDNGASGGAGGPSNIEPAPNRPSWRRQQQRETRPFSEGRSSQTSQHSYPPNAQYDALAKPKSLETRSKILPSGPAKSHSPGRSAKPSKHGEGSNLHSADLTRPRSPKSHARSSFSGLYDTAPSSSRHVVFSPTLEQGASGSTSRKRLPPSFQEQEGSNKEPRIDNAILSKNLRLAVSSDGDDMILGTGSRMARGGRRGGRGGIQTRNSAAEEAARLQATQIPDTDEDEA